MESLKGFSVHTRKTLWIREVYAIRRNAASQGLSESMMDENAGHAVAAEVVREARGKRVLFLCGTGGKGSIGMAAARHAMAKVESEVTIIGRRERIVKEAALVNYSLFGREGKIREGKEGMEVVEKRLSDFDFIVDAIVGVGLRGALSQEYANAVRAVNGSGKPVISIDVPSGMDADTGKAMPVCIKPKILLELHKYKRGIERKSFKESKLLDIGIPLSAEIMAGPGDIALATEPKAMASNKYSNGSVLVIGGSLGYTGAPALAAAAAQSSLAALRTRAGYVTLMVPKKAYPIIAKVAGEVVVKSLAGETFCNEDFEEAWRIRHDALVIGPGLSDNEESYSAIAAFVRKERMAGKAVVADASAVKALALHKKALEGIIVTPHDGEFECLSGTATAGLPLKERAGICLRFAERHRCIIVLKGNETIVSDGDLLKINRSESPALATMGTGDVLAGIIASYATAHSGLFEDAVAGVYLHSRIGDMLGRSKGLHITAGDVVGFIPDALRIFDRIS